VYCGSLRLGVIKEAASHMNRINRVRRRAWHARARTFTVVVAAVVAAGSGTAAATVGSAPAGAALTAVTQARQVTPGGSLGLPALSDASRYILAPSSRTVRATRVTESTPTDDDYVQAGNQVSELDAHQLDTGTRRAYACAGPGSPGVIRLSR
jgi:hypothetical protein